jgi:hypothetical protein
MSTLIELTVADNEHEDIAIVWHAHQSYSGLGVLGIWARRSRHGVAVRSVPGGNKTLVVIEGSLSWSILLVDTSNIGRSGSRNLSTEHVNFRSQCHIMKLQIRFLFRVYALQWRSSL